MTVDTQETAAVSETLQQPNFVLEARVTHGRGRYLLGSESRVLVTDSGSRPGGAGAFGPTELLLSSLSSCLLGYVERHASEAGVTLGTGTLATLTATRNDGDRTVFRSITIEMFIDGATQAQGEEFVSKYTDSCPIYNTVRRGGPLSIAVSTTQGHRVLADNAGDWER